MAAPAPVAPARVPNEDSEIVAEGKFLKALVRPDLQPAEVLAILAEYRRRFPKQQLGGQADFAELGAHIAMRQPAQALAIVERREASADARLAEIQVLHGELLGELGRCAEALDPFEHALGASPELADRAWFGKASCLTRLGRVPEAQTTLRGYLSRFPQGRFAAQVRAVLRAQ